MGRSVERCSSSIFLLMTLYFDLTKIAGVDYGPAIFYSLYFNGLLLHLEFEAHVYAFVAIKN